MLLGANEFEFFRKIFKNKKHLLMLLIVIMGIVSSILFILTSWITAKLLLSIFEVFVTSIHISVTDYQVTFSSVFYTAGAEMLLVIVTIFVFLNSEKINRKTSLYDGKELAIQRKLIGKNNMQKIGYQYLLANYIFTYGIFGVGCYYFGYLKLNSQFLILLISLIVIGGWIYITFLLKYDTMIQKLAIYYAFQNEELFDLINQAKADEDNCVIIPSKKMHGKVQNAVYGGVFHVRDNMKILELKPNETIELWLTPETLEALNEHSINSQGD